MVEQVVKKAEKSEKKPLSVEEFEAIIKAHGGREVTPEEHERFKRFAPRFYENEKDE